MTSVPLISLESGCLITIGFNEDRSVNLTALSYELE